MNLQYKGSTSMLNRFVSFFTDKDYIRIVAVIFFVVIAVLYTFPVLEGDFFWHVKTGQWIWEHKSLPSSDPFSYTINYINNSEHFAQRNAFILKQYWLGQLALYGVWKMAGEAGMVVLRATIYTGTLAFIYWWLKRSKSGIIPL